MQSHTKTSRNIFVARLLLLMSFILINNYQQIIGVVDSGYAYQDLKS